MVNFKRVQRWMGAPCALVLGLMLGLIPKANAYPNTNQSWYAAPESGWLWYKRTPLRPTRERSAQEEKEERKARQDRDNACKMGASYPYAARMERLRKAFEEIQAKAILEPTLDNVVVMQRAQNVIMDRSTAFEEAWMLASLVLGDNFKASGHPSPLHRKIYQERSDRELDQRIHDCAQTFGLFFLFKKDCPWCHAFAPVVKQFADTYGFTVKAISPDGQPLALFPDAVLDNGIIANINPEGIFPCLFLVGPQSRQVIPLSRGLVNHSELRENFKAILPLLARQEPGKQPRKTP